MASISQTQTFPLFFFLAHHHQLLAMQLNGNRIKSKLHSALKSQFLHILNKRSKPNYFRCKFSIHLKILFSYGGAAQWSSRPPTKQKIPGSNPARV
jgi:hypothetical protein